MRYEQIRYVPEQQDPSITIETADVVAKVIDNTGLELAANPDVHSYYGRYGLGALVGFSHHLGYHGLRSFYHKAEKRNLVVPFASWLNLQAVELSGIANDPVDERAWAGVGRGWPIRMESRGAGAALAIDPLPRTQLSYSIEFQPAEPDGVDFSIRFRFGRRPEAGPRRFRASWPCYMNACDDVRLFYPRGDSAEGFRWAALGERPDIVLGEPVGYVHAQRVFTAEAQALPLAYGPLGEYALILMFSDPSVRFFVVDCGGHSSLSPVQNPAWDFQWVVDDYPLDREIGFDGRIVYTRIDGPQDVLARYNQWAQRRKET